MANTTVYPFGTGGSLPSSIGVINDLTTGGTTDALSAQQGVVLKGMTEKVTEIDLSTLGVLLYIIAAGGAWSSTATHKTVQLPVTPGQTYRITANATNPSYYAFLASLSLPTAGGSPNYSSGYSGRIEVSANTTTEITIPSDTHYLYIALYNQSTNQTPQGVELVELFDNVDELIDGAEEELVGDVSSNLCDYDTDVFSFTGASSLGKVEKVGNSGYLLTNTKKTNGIYFVFGIPSGLVDGKTYLLSFNYKSWLSASWYLRAVGDDYSDRNPSRVGYIPASGYGRMSVRYTYCNGDKYFRLASSSQNAGCCLLIEDLSIVESIDTIAGLSARMDNLDGGFENLPDNTFHSYFGRRVDLTERTYTYSSYMSMQNHQGAACYGKYAFAFVDRMQTVYMYNLETQTLLATVTQAALDTFHHCNQAFFGTEFYDASDVFPLVYISVNNDGTSAGGYLEAYRIVPTMGNDDYSSFTISLVQTITLPVMSESNALGNANFVLDEKSGYLYTYSRNNDTTAPNYLTCRITKWEMPTLSDGDITLTDDDILDSWETDTSALNMQGGAIKNHLLFIFRGYQGAGYIQLHIFDLVRKDRVALVNLLGDGFTMEPEGAFFWGNTLCTTGTTMYRFFFK